MAVMRAAALAVGFVLADVVSAEDCQGIFQEGWKVCEGKDSSAICDPTGECQEYIGKARGLCTDSDTYYDEETASQNSIMEALDTLMWMCSSDCTKNFMDAEDCFKEESSMEHLCSEDCDYKLETLSACHEEIPGEFDDDGKPSKISDVVTMVQKALAGCNSFSPSPMFSPSPEFSPSPTFYPSPSSFSPSPMHYPSPGGSDSCMTVKIPSSVASMYKVRHC